MKEAVKKPVEVLLEQYAESHRNHINEVIHFVCVPAIMWTLLGVLWAIHPVLALLVSVIALSYYFYLSTQFGWGMLTVNVGMLLALYMLPPAWVLPVCLTVFVVAWVFQFIGHHIEGKKPSFFDDLRFLLIGPLFVLGFLYRKLHITY